MMSRYRLFDVVQRALGPFSRLFHRMLTHGSENPPRDIFPEHTSVEHWHSTLLYLGWLPRKEKSVRIRDESLVKQLYLCKSNKTKSLHEYVVAAIQTPDRTIVNIRIDRVRGEPRPAQGITDSDAVGPTNASYASSSVGVISRQSSQSSVPSRASCYPYSFSPESRRAEDSIRCNLDANPSTEVAQCLVFNTGCEPKLMDLVFVVFAAHEYDNTYTIFGPQCYWYSKCIYEAIKALVGEGSYHEKTKHSPNLGRSASVASSIYFPGDASRPAHHDQEGDSPGTEVDPLLSSESWSPHRSSTDFKIPITRTPRKEVMSRIQSHYKTLKMNFDTEERDRAQEFAAREADRQARIQAEERVVYLEEEARRYSEAIEALRAEVARLQAADV